MSSVLEQIRDEVAPRLDGRPHRGQCDTSCPDCLRSYDNRHLHSVLDWRLALDLAEIAAGGIMRLERWLDLGASEAGVLADVARLAGLEVEALQAGVLHGVVCPARRRAVLLSHPLWRFEEPFWTGEQRQAMDDARAQLAPDVDLMMFDLLGHRRRPQHAFVWLATGSDKRFR